MDDSLHHLRRPGIACTPFCPGCGHGILLNTVLRAADALQIPERELLFVSGIGCAGWIPSPHFNADTLHTLHGRAIPFAVGAKRANPRLTTIVISGDGDLLSIGGNHLIHAAARNDDITVICANNYVYGMTGGQTAPTSPQGTRTSTHPQGTLHRPLDACALARAAGASYVARFPVSRPAALAKAVERAVRTQGFSFVEALSPCPTQYGRKNRLSSVVDLYEALDAACVFADDEQDASSSARQIVIGEFI